MDRDFGCKGTSEVLFLREGVLAFYESEAAKGALMRAQKRITTEGAIVAKPQSETRLAVTVYHTDEVVAREVADVLFRELREIFPMKKEQA